MPHFPLNMTRTEWYCDGYESGRWCGAYDIREMDVHNYRLVPKEDEVARVHALGFIRGYREIVREERPCRTSTETTPK